MENYTVVLVEDNGVEHTYGPFNIFDAIAVAGDSLESGDCISANIKLVLND